MAQILECLEGHDKDKFDEVIGKVSNVSQSKNGQFTFFNVTDATGSIKCATKEGAPAEGQEVRIYSQGKPSLQLSVREYQGKPQQTLWVSYGKIENLGQAQPSLSPVGVVSPNAGGGGASPNTKVVSSKTANTEEWLALYEEILTGITSINDRLGFTDGNCRAQAISIAGASATHQSMSGHRAKASNEPAEFHKNDAKGWPEDVSF